MIWLVYHYKEKRREICCACFWQHDKGKKVCIMVAAIWMKFFVLRRIEGVGGKTEYLRKLKPTKTIQSKKFSTQLFWLPIIRRWRYGCIDQPDTGFNSGRNSSGKARTVSHYSFGKGFQKSLNVSTSFYTSFMIR